ncbi:cystinosin homolog isoform X2 [Thrips palmi]|uniref:Cystinosin homolog n=1 Tax=Thrips palmi TaxID=161013 RepID=A0A6P8Y1W5_THRPL|nr:cystinosin homolog isoform X2 [Thrips palmi]
MAMLLPQVFITIVLLWGAQAQTCNLLIDPQDLTVVVEEPVTFKLSLSNCALTEDINVKFAFSYADIVRAEPCEVDIPANASQGFSEVIKVFGLSPGHVEISTNVSSPAINTDNAFVKVASEYSDVIAIASTVIGWIYFVVWSISFYPQVYENWKRKSVVGLNFDFVALNLIGFSLYSIFNCGLYWIPAIQEQYLARHMHSSIPVLPNDIFFSVHAVLLTLITIIQCFMYERGGQTVSIVAKCIQGVFFCFLFISLLCSVFGVLSWLDFLYYCSYVKLTITLIKYVPQGYMNYQRKSTVGWSIGNILCDFTGGVFSVLQMVLDAYNFNDWSSIFGSPTKFGLGLFSVLFDIFFMVQHYILYRTASSKPYDVSTYM